MPSAGSQDPDQAGACPQVQDHVASSKGEMASEEKASELRNQHVAGHADETVLIEKEVNGVVA
jgi:hypothetical protein